MFNLFKEESDVLYAISKTNEEEILRLHIQTWTVTVLYREKVFVYYRKKSLCITERSFCVLK